MNIDWKRLNYHTRVLVVSMTLGVLYFGSFYVALLAAGAAIFVCSVGHVANPSPIIFLAGVTQWITCLAGLAWFGDHLRRLVVPESLKS